MKKHRLFLFTMIIILLVFLSSCSKKTGCYFSSLPELKLKEENRSDCVELMTGAVKPIEYQAWSTVNYVK